MPAEDVQAFKAELATKFQLISKTAQQQDKVLGVTGCSDAKELCQELFTVLASLELVQEAYSDCDSYYTQKPVAKTQRLINYL